MGIKTKKGNDFLQYGLWYESDLYDNIFVSLITPELISPDIENSYLKRTSRSELNKIVYLTAYDLTNLSINFVHGTKYPGIPNKNKKSLRSINLSGSIPPYMLNKSVGVFIGGYKKAHGRFKYGEHKGKAYGYIENGVVLSKMEAGLATL